MVNKKMLTNTVLVGAISLATLSLTGCTTEDVLEYVPKMTQEVLVYGPVIPYEDSNESDTNTEVDVTEIATTETNITETDIELTELGHQQAIETGKKILEEGIQADEILYSPLVRAADTAKHISEITGIPAREEPRLLWAGELGPEAGGREAAAWAWPLLRSAFFAGLWWSWTTTSSTWSW